MLVAQALRVALARELPVTLPVLETEAEPSSPLAEGDSLADKDMLGEPEKEGLELVLRELEAVAVMQAEEDTDTVMLREEVTLTEPETRRLPVMLLELPAEALREDWPEAERAPDLVTELVAQALRVALARELPVTLPVLETEAVLLATLAEGDSLADKDMLEEPEKEGLELLLSEPEELPEVQAEEDTDCVTLTEAVELAEPEVRRLPVMLLEPPAEALREDCPEAERAPDLVTELVAQALRVALEQALPDTVEVLLPETVLLALLPEGEEVEDREPLAEPE